MLLHSQAPVLVNSHEFVFRGEANTVHVAGTFNGWSGSAWPLTKSEDGVWRRIGSLPIGRHQYKFVIDGSRWIVDPESKTQIRDGAGNVNSTLDVFPVDYSSPARMGDGVIALSTMGHKAASPQIWLHKGQVGVVFRLRPNDVQKVTLVINGQERDMPVSSRSEFFETRKVVFPSKAKSFTYHFRVNDGKKVLLYGKEGPSSSLSAPFQVQAEAIKGANVPAWAQGSVLYQIFGDRFENGSTSNDPENVLAWDGKPTYSSWLGGDVAGIAKRMDYIKSLNVSAVYFNPVFAGPSNHRYDTTNYELIDPRFGTNEEFKALTANFKMQGIKVILDGVFNHTSTDFPQFKSIRELGEMSPDLNWFFIKSFPVVPRSNPPYEVWNNHGAMPKVNLAHPPARDYMLNLVDFWNENASIDGWRLDVANEVSMDFWRAFRTRVKATGEDKWIIGEVWTDATPWLNGDQWDSAMGYQFRGEALKFIAHDQGSAQEFMDGLFEIYNSYAPQVSHNLMNLLGSHDTPRFLNECGGDKKLAMLGATALLTWPGSPSIYYGDEIGMAGGQDPDNRRGMVWEQATDANPVLSHYRKLISARRSNSALSHGEPIQLAVWSEKKSLAFGREFGQSKAIVFINRSAEKQILSLPLPSSWKKWSTQPLTDVLENSTVSRPIPGTLRLTLAPYTSAVLVPSSRASFIQSGDKKRQ